MGRGISRRQLLRAAAVIAGSLGLGKVLALRPTEESDLKKNFLPTIYAHPTPTQKPSPTPTSTPTATSTPSPTPTNTPTATSTPGPSSAAVVHVHSNNATSWDFATGWFGDYVDQSTVNNMVDEGLKQLTGQPTVVAAWQALLPGYTPGRAIAIKVNFNNSAPPEDPCGYTDNRIDALIEPVNALIRGMQAMGVQGEDIWVYDAVRRLPDHFRTGCLYPNVRFFDNGCAEYATFDSGDPDAEVSFDVPGLTPRRITDVVIGATYLINMPIMKDHVIAAVTLGLKNHLGTIDEVVRPGDDNLHGYIGPEEPLYNPDYNPLIQIYMNRHIRDKTVLTVGDGLYGALTNTTSPPSRWATFGNDAPNSLFLATDPVAIDCVMFDFLDAEPVYHPRYGDQSDRYLQLAADAGLGVFERGDPWGSGYSEIGYVKIEL